MRKFTILVMMALISSFVFGQSLQERKTISIPVKDGQTSIEYKNVIWENDFSNAEDWIAEYDAGNPNDGPWVISTTGPVGSFSAGMGAMESTTAENGFAMYDSDGIGVSETSQDSKFIYNGTIDCTELTKVAITFESYYRRFRGNCYVEISLDEETWTQYQIHADLSNNSSTANPAIVMVNVTDVAAGNEIYLRLRYIGEWDYAWMVDDIKVFEAPDYDVALEQVRINFWPEYINYGYSGFFGQVPAEQIDGIGAPVFFSGIIKNYGTETVTPSLDIAVSFNGDELYTASQAMEVTLATEALDTVSTGEPYFLFDPATLGEYTFELSASIPGQEDQNLINNAKTYKTVLTENVYAHDNDMITGSWSTCNYTDGCIDGDIIGVTYPFFVDTKVNSIDFYISSMTQVGAAFVAKLMMFDEGSSSWVEMAASEFINIEDESQIGRMYSVTTTDDFYVAVPEGEFVEILAAVEYFTSSGTYEWRFGIDATAPTSGWETWMYFAGSDEWFYYGGDLVPIIRLNVGEVEPYVDQSLFADVSIFPNPTTGIVSITNVEGANIEVVNLMGQVVASVNNAYEVSNIDLSALANGTYFVKIVKENQVYTSKLNLVK